MNSIWHDPRIRHNSVIALVVALLNLTGCRPEATPVASVEIVDAMTDAQVQAIHDDLMRKWNSASGIVVCAHTQDGDRIVCKPINAIEPSGVDLMSMSSVRNTLEKHERRLRTHEIPAQNEVSLFTESGQWLLSSSVHDGRITGFLKHDAMLIGHEFDAVLLIREYAANKGVVLTGDPLRGPPAAHP